MCPLVWTSEPSKVNPSTCVLGLLPSLLLKAGAPVISSFYSSISFSRYIGSFTVTNNATTISPTVQQSEGHSLDLTSPLAMVRFLCSGLQQNPLEAMSLLSVPTPAPLAPLILFWILSSQGFTPATLQKWLWSRSPVNTLVATICLASGVPPIAPLRPVSEMHICKNLRFSQREGKKFSPSTPNLILLHVWSLFCTVRFYEITEPTQLKI